MSSRRQQLLDGVTSLNRREYERNDSEEVTATSRAHVADGPDKRVHSSSGDAGGSVPADKVDLQAVQEGLEGLLRAQIVSRYTTRDEIELEISTHEHALLGCWTALEDVNKDITIIGGILEKEYGDTGRSTGAKGEVPAKESGDKAETKEGS